MPATESERGFTRELRLGLDQPGERLWKLAFTLRYQAAPGYVITMPRGFRTDLASTGLLRGVLLPDPRTAWAAVVHDFLYKRQTVVRSVADAIFYQALIDSEVPRKWALSYYYAVRAFGWRAWNRNRKERTSHA